MNKKSTKLILGITAAIGMLLIIFVSYRSAFRSLNAHFISADIENTNITDSIPISIPKNELPKNRIASIPILMYHHIGTAPEHSDPLREGLTVSPADFESQLKWLKENNYESVSLQDILLLSEGLTRITWPQKPIVFTFDDGYADVFENAVPILKKYNYTGSFGIISSWPGATFGTNQYASWDEISKAENIGMEILCHTQNHFDGSSKKFSQEYIYNNLTGCQKDLQNHLKKVKPILIYPYGHYTAEYIEQAKKAGFAMGITVHSGSHINLDNLMETPRIRPGKTVEELKKVLEKNNPST